MTSSVDNSPNRQHERPSLPRHVMTIDLECWHDLMLRNAEMQSRLDKVSLARQVDSILELLSETETKCTFFVLANVAEEEPQIVERLIAAGHEIGIHGTAHKPLFCHNPQSLRADIEYCKKTIEDRIGRPVVCHRAPMFSIVKQNLWALDVLAELGITTDSSIFPMRLPRYGIDGFPRRPQMIETPSGKSMFEVPLSIVSAGGKWWPISGGGYARVAPTWLLERAVRKLEVEALPLILYFHPYEFDERPLVPPKQFGVAKRMKLSLKWNSNRRSIREKVRFLLSEFSFGRMDEYVKSIRQ